MANIDSDGSTYKVCAARPRSGPGLFLSGLRARVAFAGSALRVLAAPLSLLTLLVCCVRSEDTEANELIGGDTKLHDSTLVASFTTAVTVLASTDLACSRGDDDHITCLHLVYSDCDSAHATFVRTCFALFPVFVALCQLRICLVRVVWRRRARHATRMACASVFAFLSVSACCFYIIMLCSRPEPQKRTTPQPEGSSLGSSGELRCLVVLRVVLRVVVLQ